MRTKLVSDQKINVGEWLALAKKALKGRLPDPEWALSPQVLLANVLNKNRSWILAHPEAEIASTQSETLENLLARLAAGEPLPYLIGHWEFYGRDFEVNPDVLIPRPETEMLVEHGLDWLSNHPQAGLAADVGTGTGCIAVSLAAGAPQVRCLAVDQSWNALQVARRNGIKHSVGAQIGLLQGDLLTACAGPFDLVCANLPYIPTHEVRALPVAKYEPVAALAGGDDGLAFIRKLLMDAWRWLAPDGLILLEMQFDQGEAITDLAHAYLPGANTAIFADLAGLPRLIQIQNGAASTK